MPYIHEGIRHGEFTGDSLARSVDEVIEHIRTFYYPDRQDLCHCAIRKVVQTLQPEHGWRYKHLNRAFGTILSASAEFRRRLTIDSSGIYELTIENVEKHDVPMDGVIYHITSHTLDDREGICNYTISRIVVGSMKPEDSVWSQFGLIDTVGAFELAAASFYKDVVAPYEDKCIKRNGDIPEYA